MFYGTMPLKMKSIIITGSPWWMTALIGLMRLFISKKMSSRIHNYKISRAVESLGGAGFLPEGTMGGQRKFVGRYGLDIKAKVAAKVVAL